VLKPSNPHSIGRSRAFNNLPGWTWVGTYGGPFAGRPGCGISNMLLPHAIGRAWSSKRLSAPIKRRRERCTGPARITSAVVCWVGQASAEALGRRPMACSAWRRRKVCGFVARDCTAGADGRFQCQRTVARPATQAGEEWAGRISSRGRFVHLGELRQSSSGSSVASVRRSVVRLSGCRRIVALAGGKKPRSEQAVLPILLAVLARAWGPCAGGSRTRRYA